MIKAKFKDPRSDKMLSLTLQHTNISKALDAIEHICQKRKMKVTAVKY
jgi:hypothetical protein